MEAEEEGIFSGISNLFSKVAEKAESFAEKFDMSEEGSGSGPRRQLTPEEQVLVRNKLRQID